MATKKITANTNVKAEVKPVVKPEPKSEPKKEAKQEIDGRNYEVCKKCQSQAAARMDRYNWRCPDCGDYSA
jgi:hypothetical protein